MRTPSQLLTTDRFPGRLHVMVRDDRIGAFPLCVSPLLLDGMTAPAVLRQVMWVKNFPASEFGYGSPVGYARLSSFSQQVQ